MNNKSQQPNQDPVSNALLDYLLKSQANPGAQTSQALQTIMGNPQIAKAYNDRANYYNTTNQDMASTIDSQAKNGVNGFAVNVAPNLAGLANELPQNQAATNSFLAGLVAQASGETNNQNSTAAGVYNQQQQTGLGQQNLNMQERLNGMDPATGDFVGAGDTTGSAGMDTQASGYSPQAVEKLKTQGAKDLFPDGMSVPQQMQVYHEIQQAGGLGNFRKQYPQSISKPDSEVLGATNDTLQKVNYLQDQLKKSPALQKALNTPGLTQVLQMGNKWLDQYMLGLTPADMQAVAYMSQLNATNDRAQVGGRLDNYLLQRLGGSGVGIHNNVQTNQKMLSEIKNHIVTNNLKPLAQQYGYDSVYDLPYVQFGSQSQKQPNGSVTLMSPDGKTYVVDQAEVGQALKNGWKEAE